jgi:hypothetical protein
MPSSIRSLPGPGLAVTVVVALAACLAAVAAHAQSLRGGRSSMDRQNREAGRHAFTFLDTSGDVHRFVEEGYLVPIPGNGDYELKPGVSFPYARPEVKLFLERLGSQYRAACGEPLVATSLTRPRSRQPRNASPRSVHPTGMAVDLRVSWSARCRRWIEGVFLSLEAEGVLDANREYHPPHYHVALFPESYAEHVARLEAEGSDEAARATAAVARYTVRRGDNLWRIASRYGTSVEDLKAVNDIRSSSIQPGQVLAIPTAPR